MNTQLPGCAAEDGASQPVSAHPSMDAVVACECGVSVRDCRGSRLSTDSILSSKTVTYCCAKEAVRHGSISGTSFYRVT